MMRSLCFSAAFIIAAMPANGRAEDKKPAKPFNEAEFVPNAISGGMLEIDLGKLAVARTKNESVKKFGQKLIDDHTKATEDLKGIAKAAGMTIPTKMNDMHQKHYDKLKATAMEEFDAAFIKHMVKDHEMDVDEFTRATKEAKTPAVKEFAVKTLPTLEKHLEMARKLQERK